MLQLKDLRFPFDCFSKELSVETIRKLIFYNLNPHEKFLLFIQSVLAGFSTDNLRHSLLPSNC